jgi:O-antigen chain-terminating methyltransferase
MEFLFKNRGFEHIEILPLHPWEAGRIAGEGELAERFNAYIYGPMDYAVVGRKVGA